MVIQAKLRVRHRGCISEEVLGDARVIHMSGDERHCLTVFKASSEEHLDRLIAGSAELLEPEGVIDRAGTWAVARCHCPRDGSRIRPVIQEEGCTLIWPVIEYDGHEFYTVLAPTRKRLNALAERLREQGDVEVERVSKVPGSTLDVAVPLSDMTQNLTRRQLDTLKAAIAAGYYETPRRAYVEELAAGMGMSRSTLQEHLQKAEAAVMKTFGTLLLTHPALDEQAVKGPGRPPLGTAAAKR